MTTVVLQEGIRMRLNLHCPKTRKGYVQLVKQRYRKAMWAFRKMMEAMEKLLSPPLFSGESNV